MPSTKAENGMTISQAFDSYRRDVIVFRSQAKSTEEQHLQACKNLIQFLGNDIKISSLTFENIRDWKFDMDNRLSPKSVRGYLIKLRVVLSYMHLKGVSCVDPSLIRLPKAPDTLPQVASPSEVSMLIEATSKLRNKCIISLLYSSGLRVSELCALDRMNVKNDFFPVIGKGGKSRLCFIDERTRGFLDQYLKERSEGWTTYRLVNGKMRPHRRYAGDNNPALFISADCQRIKPGTVQEIFKVARRKAGVNLNIHPHTMRHSFATDLNNNGAGLYAISKMLGHSSLETTSIYLHLFDKDLKETFAKYHTT